MDLTKPYADKFYESLKDCYKFHPLKYLQSYMAFMRPTQEILDSHIVKLVTIKGTIPDTEASYKKTLEENIEILIRCRTLRELAAKEKIQWPSWYVIWEKYYGDLKQLFCIDKLLFGY